ncbi:MAG TPA: response regulator, partial [Opitutaceae bacterium]|nr:response regulator [Opitutaceae bacterium]
LMHGSPDVGLVITDLQMPQSSGVELCQTLREEFPQVPVIAMTGSGGPAESDDLRRARAAGAKSALQKPFNLADFYDAVNQATWTRA